MIKCDDSIPLLKLDECKPVKLYHRYDRPLDPILASKYEELKALMMKLSELRTGKILIALPKVGVENELDAFPWLKDSIPVLPMRLPGLP